MVTNEQRIKALSALLEIDTENITVVHDERHEFGVIGGDYLVLTEEEADKEVKERILEDVWAFKPDFLIHHINFRHDVSDHEWDASMKALERVQGECCENCNALLRAMLKDDEEFVKAAVEADGRGHFLNRYDGGQEEEKVGEVWFYIYRTN